MGYDVSKATSGECAGAACNKDLPADITACCKAATGPKCSAGATANDFCGTDKVIDSGKAEHMCHAGTTCDKDLPADVDACCKATVGQKVEGSLTFSNLDLADDAAKAEFKTAVGAALALSLSIAKDWVVVTVATSRRLDARRLAGVTANYVITIPADQINSGLNSETLKNDITEVKTSAKGAFVDSLNAGLSAASQVTVGALSMADPTIPTTDNSKTDQTTTKDTTKPSSTNSTQDDPSNAMRGTAITAVLVAVGLNL